MQPVHYFQRYSQPENVATNNTLLLFSRLYYHSPLKFNNLLKKIIEKDILCSGVIFKQQEKSQSSIPDAIIEQESFKIVIETKLYNNFSINQLKNHCNTFKDEKSQILLSLSPGKIYANEIENAIELINISKKNKIYYTHCTFLDIINAIRSIISEHETEFTEIIDDYEDYCYSSDLIDRADGIMRAVTCRHTIDENFKYNLYYDPSDRGYSKHGYIGVYADKCIKAIGKIENIITADYEFNSKNINILQSTSKITNEQKQRIIDSINEAYTKREWEINTGHQFFLVENFIKTNYIKYSYGSMRRTRFFNLFEILNKETLPSTEEIARLLSALKWE